MQQWTNLTYISKDLGLLQLDLFFFLHFIYYLSAFKKAIKEAYNKKNEINTFKTQNKKTKDKVNINE